MIDDHGPDCACTECLWMRSGTPEDTITGLKVVFWVGVVILAVLSIIAARSAHAATASPPLRTLVLEPTWVYLPGGPRILLPGGTEADICPPSGGAQAIYDPFARALFVSASCPERPLFADGFES